MRQREFTVRFHTPAFLGNAKQVAQWRTPPFKALLRQWWRVAYAADADRDFAVDLAAMRREEGLLFGNAWLDDNFCKSLVRLRLSRWDEGKLKQDAWPKDQTVDHPEVKDRQSGNLKPVGSALYLGYGPLTFKGGTSLKAAAAIGNGEEAKLRIAFPEAQAGCLTRALWLMDRYGTLGGRSRNGWGSFSLEPVEPAPDLAHVPCSRPWRDCLDRDWPHAIGQDENGALIWKTLPFKDWQALIKCLAQIKIGLRTQFKFQSGKNAKLPELRHWLSYPVTNHSVMPWGNDKRLPNSLRFKVRLLDEGQVCGVIFHVPHAPPKDFRTDINAITQVWQDVHRFLDRLQEPRLSRIPV